VKLTELVELVFAEPARQAQAWQGVPEVSLVQLVTMKNTFSLCQ